MKIFLVLIGLLCLVNCRIPTRELNPHVCPQLFPQAVNAQYTAKFILVLDGKPQPGTTVTRSMSKREIGYLTLMSHIAIKDFTNISIVTMINIEPEEKP